MRDLLTALAGAVILILVAALAAPPFVDWQGHRAFVDHLVSRSIGAPARSEGRVDIRLLPSPRLRLDQLRLGNDAAKPALDLRFVKAEIALAPLLKGEVRFTETRIGRAEIKLPVTEGDAILLPEGLADSLGGRDLAIEDLHIQQFLLTTMVPATGRTDQLYAEGLHLQAPAIAGPWRIEGTSGGLPFRLGTGEPGDDGSVLVKLSGGGDRAPRFDAEAKLKLTGVAKSESGSGPRPLRVSAEGSARLVIGPPTQIAGAYLPTALSGKFKARGAQVAFEGVSAEIDPGGHPLRLTGTGRLDLRQWRAGLVLEARRLDLDAFLMSPSGQGLIARGLPRAGSDLPVMLDLDLAVETATLGFEDWSNLALSGTFERNGGLLLRSLSATAPGQTQVSASGQVDTAPAPRFTGSLTIATPTSDGLGRYLRRLGVENPFLTVLDGRPIEAGADLSVGGGDVSLRNLRLALGTGQITGNARYAGPERGGRGRLDAQIAARGIDIATLPPFGGAFAGLHDHDLGLTVEARDMRYGATGSGNGRIAASIQSDGTSLVVDSLDVTDLAGANAKLAGRITPDGGGRITGRLAAPVAAPLIALLDRVWVRETRLIPTFLREAPLDLAVSVERDAGSAEALQTSAKGKAGGGSLDLSLTSRAGRIERGTAALATAKAGPWFGRADIAGLQQPADLRLTASRPPGDASVLGIDAAGTIAGLKLSTPKPILLGQEGGPPRAGEARIEAADFGPFLALSGLPGLAPGAWPATLTATLTREDENGIAELAGSVAGAGVSGRFVREPDGALGGTASLGRLSLPQLASALVIPLGSTQRFTAPPPPRPPINLDLRVETLDLGRGQTARSAAFRLGLDDGALSLRDLSAKLGEGRLSGSATLTRRNAAASISGEGSLQDASIPALADGSPITGRLSAALRFSATGDGPAALAANLAGSGDITLRDINLPETDPDALGRALARALEIDDPLRDGRLRAVVEEELSKGGAQAAGSTTSPATIIGGALRAGPLDLRLGSARWTGTLGYDLGSGRLDVRGTLVGRDAPKGWNAGVPSVQLGLGGSLSTPERNLDVGALSNGLSAVILQRELEKIELLEADQVERQRRRARIEMDRLRAAALKAAAEKAAAEKAAADKAAAEEAARQARLRAQQAAAEEAQRQARTREAEEAARRARVETDPPREAQPQGQPLEIRPPAAQP